jgi:hypothetical protein
VLWRELTEIGQDCVRREHPDQHLSSKGNNDPFVLEQPNEYQALRSRPEICYGMVRVSHRRV